MSTKNINLRQIRAFTVVAEKGSFVAAAAELNLSQPALSQSIRLLEEHIGSALFNRTTRSVYLTQLGEGFLPHARDLLLRFDSIMDDLQDVVSRKRGQVTIACLPSVASRLMPRTVAVNEKQFPGIRTIIRDTNMTGVMSLLLSGGADIGIASATTNQAELDSVVLALDEMHVVLPVTSPLARAAELRWSDIADAPLIAMTYESGVRELLEEAAQQCNIRLNIVAEVSNLATLTGMVEEGIGISVLPSLALPRSNHSFIRHRRLVDPGVQRTIRLFWKRNIGLSPAAGALLTSLRDCIATDPALLSIPDVTWQNEALNFGWPI